MKTVKGGKQFPVTVTEGGVSAKIGKAIQSKSMISHLWIPPKTSFLTK
jgi:hypothetical protein